MSLPAALARVDEIQQRIQTFWTKTPPSESAGLASGSAATAFASALEGVLGLSAPTAGGVTGSDIVTQAEKYLGVPYVFGGEDESGMDCSGLVQRVLGDLGIESPRLVSGQSGLGVEVPSLAEAQPGDLLVTNGNTHIVIYAGDGKIIHAPRPGKDVRLVENYLTDADISTIRRVAPAAGATPSASSFVLPAAGSPAPLAPALSLTAAASPPAPASTPAPIGPVSAALSTAASTASAPLSALLSTLASSASADTGRGVPASADAAVTAAFAAFAGTASTAPDAVAASAATPTTAARPPLYSQVAAPVLNLARAPDGEHTLTLRVTPENLGPVTVRAQISGGAIHVELVAPSDAGRDALRTLLVDLRRDLAGLVAHSSLTVAPTGDGPSGQSSTGPGAGWSTGSGSGSASTSSGQPGHPGAPSSGGARTPRAGSDADAEASALPPVPVAAGAGIDLYA